MLWQLWRRPAGAAGLLSRSSPLQRHTEAKQHRGLQPEALHPVEGPRVGAGRSHAVEMAHKRLELGLAAVMELNVNIAACVTVQCSVSCGEGHQQREVSCVSMQDSAVMPDSLCKKISKPEMQRKCNTQDCKDKAGG